MTYTKTRDFDVFGVPAHLLAATDVTFRGRTVPSDRRFVPVQGLVASIAGLGNPAGVRVDATPVRGKSMI